MPTRRTERVADLIRHEIAELLQRAVKDPRVGFVTLTRVEVSADLRVARVYYTVLGDEEQQQQTHRGLASAVPFLRRELGHRIRLKAVPELRFLPDEELENEIRLQHLLEELEDEPRDPDS